MNLKPIDSLLKCLIENNLRHKLAFEQENIVWTTLSIEIWRPLERNFRFDIKRSIERNLKSSKLNIVNK